MRKWISLGFGEEFQILRIVAIQERDANESYKAKWPLLLQWEAIQTEGGSEAGEHKLATTNCKAPACSCNHCLPGKGVAVYWNSIILNVNINN